MLFDISSGRCVLLVFVYINACIIHYVHGQCDTILRIPLGSGLTEVISPGFLNGYDKNLNCTWVFDVDENHFILFKITNEVDCGDKLTVYDGTDVIKSNICIEGEPVEASTSLGRSLIIQFRSDNKGTPDDIGFIVQAISAKDEHCNLGKPLVVTEEELSFTSRNFPNQYSPNTVCEYDLVPSDLSKRIEIKVPYANNEQVEVYQDGDYVKKCVDSIHVYQDDEVIGEACSTGFPNIPITFTGSNGASLKVVFKANGRNQHRGFKATYMLVDALITTTSVTPVTTPSTTPSVTTPIKVQRRQSVPELLAIDPLPSGKACRDGWLHHNNRCYFFSRQKESWFQAQFLCRMMDSTLASLQSGRENQYLTEKSQYQAYLGCYKDKGNDRLLPALYHSHAMTNKWCIDKCSSEHFIFAGTQFHSQCFCGNATWDKFQSANENECFSECKGNEAEVCGGPWRISVYDTRGRMHWIGGTDIEKEGKWRWFPSKEALTYSNWLPGEPNNQIHRDMVHEHCMSIYPDKTDNKFRWNDENCERQLHFICESRANLNG